MKSWCVLAILVGLTSCAARTEYYVSEREGDDQIADGSKHAPCSTAAHCRVLAERDGVQTYWLLYME